MACLLLGVVDFCLLLVYHGTCYTVGSRRCRGGLQRRMEFIVYCLVLAGHRYSRATFRQDMHN